MSQAACLLTPFADPRGCRICPETSAFNTQIPESEWDSIKASVLAMCASSSRSSKPTIYGLAAEAEIRRLRPLSNVGNMEVRSICPFVCAP